MQILIFAFDMRFWNEACGGLRWRRQQKTRPEGRVPETSKRKSGLLALALALGRLGIDALGDTGRLAAAIAQVIQLGAANLALADDLDRVEVRRIQREDALDALAIGNLADGEALVQPAAIAGDADALIGLNAAALAFLDLDVDLHGVAGLEMRDFLAVGELGDLFLVDLLDDVHGSLHGRVRADARAFGSLF
ncbi:hypothetical protein BOS5A_230890 [Bosea sp. EC-HK365B]|nr:hypothetical protein BOSE21B_90967 [Bosea sp. 21B]CAD5299279.1 hypothetical protein BOSE46_81037 [Bosea sp. 46]VVT61613.1 hypothetical protein BOS5A_230890 [Bosea sp. EC-HK365B]